MEEAWHSDLYYEELVVIYNAYTMLPFDVMILSNRKTECNKPPCTSV